MQPYGEADTDGKVMGCKSQDGQRECIVQSSVMTTESFLPEDDPAGSKNVGMCYN
jgi:hypothetical protein